MNDGSVIRVVQTPGNAYTCVYIVGEVDPTDQVTWTAALDRLAGFRSAALCVDLGDVGFAGTALLTFLVRVINCAPAGTSVLLCRPNRMTRRLLHLSFLDTIAIVCDDLPFGAEAPARIHVSGQRLAGIGEPR